MTQIYTLILFSSNFTYKKQIIHYNKIVTQPISLRTHTIFQNFLYVQYLHTSR